VRAFIDLVGERLSRQRDLFEGRLFVPEGAASGRSRRTQTG
jgi:hypothetical protein